MLSSKESCRSRPAPAVALQLIPLGRGMPAQPLSCCYYSLPARHINAPQAGGHSCSHVMFILREDPGDFSLAGSAPQLAQGQKSITELLSSDQGAALAWHRHINGICWGSLGKKDLGD